MEGLGKFELFISGIHPRELFHAFPHFRWNVPYLAFVAGQSFHLCFKRSGDIAAEINVVRAQNHISSALCGP